MISGLVLKKKKNHSFALFFNNQKKNALGYFYL